MTFKTAKMRALEDGDLWLPIYQMQTKTFTLQKTKMRYRENYDLTKSLQNQLVLRGALFHSKFAKVLNGFNE